MFDQVSEALGEKMKNVSLEYIQNSFHKMRRGLGVDRAVGFTLMGRGWGLTANLVNLWLIALCLSKDEQGFYYTFSSVLGLQMIFDLGFSYVVLQFASHEMASLKLGEKGIVTGDPKAKARLASLLWFSMKWYGVVALLVVLLIVPIGLYFFSVHYNSALNVVWEMPWVAIALATAGLVSISPLTAIVEGTGQVAEMALMRTTQSFLSSLALWCALLFGLKLYAAPIYSGVTFLCALTWLNFRYGAFFKNLLLSRHIDHVIGWWQEIWPFQWKIGVSFLSGYFVGQLFNPILFAFQGPAVAGQMGMSLSIAGGITALGLAWVYTKAAPFGQMIAKRDFEQLDKTFFRCLWQSLMIMTLAAGSAFGILLYLKYIHHPVGQRVLDPLPLGLILLTTLVNHVVFSESIYLRAHKREPFMWMSVASGLLTAISAYFFGKYYGALGMSAAGFAISLMVGMGFGTYLFMKARREWHVKVSL